MIQRIQTLYLALAAVVSGILIFVFSMWTTSSGELLFAQQNMTMLLMFLVSALISIVAILKFKDRKSQFVLGRLNIILNFVLLGFIVYQSQTLSGETAVSEKGIGMVLPLVSIVFIVLANKAIKKDEDLVKSVDRLR